MPIELVQKEIQRFLSSEEPEVICIRGHWGVGKTFAWNRYLKEAQAQRKIALPSYSYISLFGVNSLEELKYSIFENSVKCSDIGVEPSLETLRSNTTAVGKRLGKTSLGILQRTPFLKNYVGGLGPVWFLSVRKTIVCIDDFERKGDNLEVRDVLGLVSSLKEFKGCKVCLILNEEALGQDSSEFRRYLEKVVDVSLKFEPSPMECADIALATKKGAMKILAESCIALGISNIRLIKRIERSVRKIEPMLKEFDEQILRQGVQSLALLGWSVFEPHRAPSLEYLQRRRGTDPFGIDKERTVPENEAAWNALLDAYGFLRMDEFDLVLLDGVRDGFFDSSRVQERGSELNAQIKAAKLNNSFNDAWEMYHGSFANNEKEVADAIYQSFFSGVQYITPMNLSGTVTLFKELGKPDKAAEIINHYVANRGQDPQLFNLRNYAFAGEIKDPDVVQAFRDKYATFKREEKDPGAILLRMASVNGWNPEDITTLAALAADDFYVIFKKYSGRELHKILGACLQFDNIGNATDAMKEIPKRARVALKQIGEESAINARRVKRYGVNVTDKPAG